MTTLTEKINAINNVLRDSGSNAVQKIDFGGQIRYGYRPQYVFDAVNQIISPENWRYELIKEEIFDNQAVAEVKLFLKTDAEWLCKGSHKGQMAIVRGNIGDAQKGAITDALQKCLSLCSIGQDSYRGYLRLFLIHAGHKLQDNLYRKAHINPPQLHRLNQNYNHRFSLTPFHH